MSGRPDSTNLRPRAKTARRRGDGYWRVSFPDGAGMTPHPLAQSAPRHRLPRARLAEASAARIPKALAEGRLLLISSFADTVRRADEEAARQRNRVVAALADKIFVAYAAPHGKTEIF